MQNTGVIFPHTLLTIFLQFLDAIISAFKNMAIQMLIDTIVRAKFSKALINAFENYNGGSFIKNFKTPLNSSFELTLN